MNLSWITSLFSKKKEKTFTRSEWVISAITIAKRRGLSDEKIAEDYNISVEEVHKILHGR